MKHFTYTLVFVVLISGLFSCSSDEKPNSDLQVKIDSLTSVVAQRDSLIKGISETFAAIDSNMVVMRDIEAVLIAEMNKGKAKNVGVIRTHVDSLKMIMAANSARIESLETNLDVESEMGEVLVNIIGSMKEKILLSNIRLAELQTELATLGKDFANLFDEFIQAEFQRMTLEENVNQMENQNKDLESDLAEMEAKMKEMEEEKFKGFIAHGPKKDLIEKGMLEKGGLFQTKSFIDKVDKSLFTEVDVRNTNELSFPSGKIKLSTTHPKDSYEIVEGDTKSKIKIKDQSEFWKISKYVIVITD